MKRHILLASLLLTVSLFGVFEPGGPSIDLSKAKVETMKTDTTNFVTPTTGFNVKGDAFEWYSGFNFQVSDRAKNKQLKNDGAKYFSAKREGNTFYLHTDIGVNALRNAKGEPTVTNVVSRDVKLPGAGNYVLSFKVRGQLAQCPGTQTGLVIISRLDANGKKRVAANILQKFKPTAETRTIQVAFEMPENASVAGIALFLYGVGDLWYSDVAVTQATKKNEISIQLWPMGRMDNVFHFPSRQPIPLYFMTRNASKLPLVKPELHLCLPQGFQVVGVAGNYGKGQLFRRVGNEWIINVERARIVSEDYWMGPILLQADVEPGCVLPDAAFYLVNQGKAGTRHTFAVKVDKTLSAPQPKHYLTGPYCFSMHAFHDDVMPALVAFYKMCGFNVVQGTFIDKMTTFYHQAGFKTARWTVRPGPTNAYDMGAIDKPESVRYKLIDGTYLKANKTGWKLCPEIAASRDEYYREHVVKPLQKLVKEEGYDFVAPNWEPQDSFRGCWCERCREAFIKDSGLPAKDVRDAWPNQILDKWKDQWITFRSRQHGRLVKNVSEDVAAANAVFMPAVTSACMMETTWSLFTHYQSPYFMEYLKWVNAWGPYLYHDMCLPYVKTTGQMLKAYTTARAVNAFVEARVSKPSRRPKKMALPQGLQGSSWVTTPEAMVMEQLCFFVSRWDGGLYYFFPAGYDYRYFKALTQANALMAAAEPYVFEGKALPNPPYTVLSPLPKSSYYDGVDAKYPELTKASLIQTQAWQKGSEQLLAVGNFWEDGECFVKVNLAGLKNSQTYTIKTLLSEETFAATGKELADGYLFHVGALHWNFYLITEGKPTGTIYTKAHLEQLLEQRRNAIKASADACEKVRLAAVMQDALPDYSTIKPLSNGNISAKPVGNGIVAITAPKYTAQLNLVKGATLTSWIIDGQEFSGSCPTFSDAIMAPNPVIVTGAYRLLSLNAKEDGIEIVTERRISSKESKAHAGLLMTKRLSFRASRIACSTTVTNPSGDGHALSFRFHSMPAYRDMTFNGQPFKRDFKPRTLKPGSIQWKQKNVTVTAAIAPADQLQDFFCWDGNAKLTPTFEPLFRQIILNAGMKQQYDLEFIVK